MEEGGHDVEILSFALVLFPPIRGLMVVVRREFVGDISTALFISLSLLADTFRWDRRDGWLAGRKENGMGWGERERKASNKMKLCLPWSVWSGFERKTKERAVFNDWLAR